MTRWLTLAAALFYSALGVVAWQRGSAAARADRELSRRQILEMTRVLIERAAHEKDDLAIQQTIQALGVAPKVAYAAVVGADRRVMAHSDPLQLGKAFAPGRLKPWRVDLRDGERPWGRLYVGFSQDRQTKAIGVTSFFGFASLAGLWLVGWANQRQAKRRVSGLEEDRTRLAERLGAAEAQVQRARERSAAHRREARLLLSEALEGTSQPTLVLDENQRVIAANRSFCARVEGPVELLERAWHEIPMLRDFGAGIDGSLARPGEEIALETSRGRLTFWTSRSPSSTWVRLQ